MKLALQLAYKNLIGAGLRTWLNVAVLSFVFVVIILFHGLIEGWNQQSISQSIDWEYAAGHLHHPDYDPLNPFSIQEAHGTFAGNENGHLTPVLVRQATVYPQGRMKSVLLKGIPAQQSVLTLPTQALDSSEAAIPVLIGTRMAESLKLNLGDQLLLRWRDKNGTFDAADVVIAKIFDTSVATVDNGQVWISIETLWEMTGLQNEASFYVADEGYEDLPKSDWQFEDQDALLKDFRALIQLEKISGGIMYAILLMIALIAIFDTQVLSIFRRQREIGTYVALGMTRMEVLRLFTVEGAMYSVFGVIVGCLYGIPLFMLFGKIGFTFPEFYQGMGINFPRTVYPVFGIDLIVGTCVVLIVAATAVSLIPARKIVKMDPVNALKGKLQ